MRQSYLEKSLERIINISVQTKQSVKSHILLFQEHYRLITNFSQIYRQRPAKPGINFTQMISDDLPDLSNEFIFIQQHIKEMGLKNDFFRYDSYKNILRFASWRNHYSEKSKDIINPYEPLIIFYERGGYVTPERGGWDIGIDYVKFDITAIMQRETPYTILQHDELDKLDQKL